MDARRIAAVAALAGLTAACAATRTPAPVAPIAAAPAPQAGEVLTRTVVIREPVKVACVPHALPPAPHYPDNDAALRGAGGAADRYQLLAAGRILRAKRLAMLEKIVESCR